MEAIETFEHAGLQVRIYQDSDASSPDTWGNTDLFLITTRNRYFEVERLGFALDGCRVGEYKANYHVLPLYAYIHSGVALSVSRGGQFSDQWDSGQIGYVLVQKRAGFRNILKAAEMLVAEWNQWLAGDVYGYVVEGADGEQIDSCWGFYGMEHAIEEAKGAADAEQGAEVKRAAAAQAVMAL
jgi:hypothetical protein